MIVYIGAPVCSGASGQGYTGSPIAPNEYDILYLLGTPLCGGP